MLTWVLLAVAVSILPTAALYAGRVRRQRLLSEGGLGETPADVDGHGLTAGWIYSGTADSGQPDNELWRYEVRVQDVLPPWASLYLTGDGVDAGRSLVLGRALFGDDIGGRIPLGWIVSADGSNLVVQGEEVAKGSGRGDLLGVFFDLLSAAEGMPRDAQVEAFSIALARAALEKDDEGIAERLDALAEAGRPEAVELLGLRLSHTEVAQAAIVRAARDPRAELRLAAARCGAPEATRTMTDIAADPELPRGLRNRAVRLLAMKDRQSCLRELVDATKGEVDGVLLEALRLDGSPQTARLAMRALEHQDETTVSAAADILARIGGRDAIEPLQRRLERGGPRLLTRSLELTLELVRARLTGGPGSLSVIAPGPVAERGQLSVPEADRGALSPAEDRGDLSEPEDSSG